MGPTVVLGQNLADLPRPVGDGAAADLAARDRKLRHSHGEASGTWLAHHIHNASTVRVTLTPDISSRPTRGYERVSPSGRSGITITLCRARGVDVFCPSLGSAEGELHEISAGADTQLLVSVAQVKLDSSPAQEQPSGHVSVGVPAADQGGDLLLLRGSAAARSRDRVFGRSRRRRAVPGGRDRPTAGRRLRSGRRVRLVAVCGHRCVCGIGAGTPEGLQPWPAPLPIFPAPGHIRKTSATRR